MQLPLYFTNMQKGALLLSKMLCIKYHEGVVCVNFFVKLQQYFEALPGQGGHKNYYLIATILPVWHSIKL